jgi:hypothetical protein
MSACAENDVLLNHGDHTRPCLDVSYPTVFVIRHRCKVLFAFGYLPSVTNIVWL